MNAPLPRVTFSRERTALEHADTMLLWRESLIDLAVREQTPAEFERHGNASLMAADRLVEEAKEYSDPDLRLVLVLCAGRYAAHARVAFARAKELRG
jgi:hypothetical protein